MRAASERKALPAFGMSFHWKSLTSNLKVLICAVLMNILWSSFALSTVFVVPHRATSALLMTGINHAAFAIAMITWNKMTVAEVLGWDSSSKGKVS